MAQYGLFLFQLFLFAVGESRLFDLVELELHVLQVGLSLFGRLL